MPIAALLDALAPLRHAAAALLALSVAACSKAGDAPAAGESAAVDLATVTLRIGEQTGIVKSGLEAAGQLEGVPYTIEWATFTAGPPLLEAINADAVDIGAVGDTPPIFAQAAGAPIRIVAVTRNRPEYKAILVPKGSSVRALRELKGKKVAVAKGSRRGSCRRRSRSRGCSTGGSTTASRPVERALGPGRQSAFRVADATKEDRMTKLRLYSAKACPFAHRTRLALEEKAIDAELIEVDLQNKPRAFVDASLYGKVPAIEHEGHRIWESAIINEYLDEAFPDPPLLPREPGRRALARIWIDHANTRLVPAFAQLLRAETPDQEAEGRKALGDVLAFLEREALSRSSGPGPYWLGADVSLVDFAFYPWFERLPAVDRLRGFSIPAELTRLRAWIDAVEARDAVRAIANPVDFYVERYAKLVKPAKATAA
ncbi:glutathione S-transferase N-terminal domain-containing protein [Sorangium sp. So ce542]|uniref:glutathione S-transferase N-terminal domain-containing protein n=1 Tax=Sorangium sp. So ce542 TaxID=3133316 RepID=UPI003F5DE84B